VRKYSTTIQNKNKTPVQLQYIKRKIKNQKMKNTGADQHTTALYSYTRIITKNVSLLHFLSKINLKKIEFKSDYLSIDWPSESSSNLITKFCSVQ